MDISIFFIILMFLFKILLVKMEKWMSRDNPV